MVFQVEHPESYVFEGLTIVFFWGKVSNTHPTQGSTATNAKVVWYTVLRPSGWRFDITILSFFRRSGPSVSYTGRPTTVLSFFRHPGTRFFRS